jgi:hypothetical protein
MSKQTKLITSKETRLSYANIWFPKSINGGPERYSATLLIPKDSEDIKKIKEAVWQAYVEGSGKLERTFGFIPEFSQIKNPLRDGDKERDWDDAYVGHYFINATSGSKPQVIDIYKNPIEDTSEIYSGVYARVAIHFYVFANADSGAFGIACSLDNVMKVADGEPLGVKSSAWEDFEDVD